MTTTNTAGDAIRTAMGSNIKIRPGWMVKVGTSVKGGVKYDREDLDQHREEAAEVSEWVTKRRIEDLDEYERARKTRQTARNLIKKACFWTPFGEMCELDKLEELDEAIAEARRMIAEHNSTAEHTKIKLFVMRGQVAKDDTEAVESVVGEIKDLLGDLDDAIQDGKVKDIRDIASRAKTMQRLLDQEDKAAGELGRAITAARTIAKAIAKKVEKDGEKLADVLKAANTSPIVQARFRFDDEDLDDGTEIAPEDALPAVATARFVDLEEDVEPEPVAEAQAEDGSDATDDDSQVEESTEDSPADPPAIEADDDADDADATTTTGTSVPGMFADLEGDDD